MLEYFRKFPLGLPLHSSFIRADVGENKLLKKYFGETPVCTKKGSDISEPL